jgi:hypothetical protein
MSKYQYDTNYFLVGKEETLSFKRHRKTIKFVKQEFLGGMYINGDAIPQNIINSIEDKIRNNDENIHNFSNYDEYLKFVGEEIILRILQKQR